MRASIFTIQKWIASEKVRLEESHVDSFSDFLSILGFHLQRDILENGIRLGDEIVEKFTEIVHDLEEEIIKMTR